MQRPSLTSLRRVGAILAVMLAALVLTTLAVAALEGALRIPDASATYLLAVVSVAVVFGTIVPFSLSIAALKHLPATTVGIVATFEPVAAAVIAWVWLGQALDAVQVVGGVVVLVGILLAETSR